MARTLSVANKLLSLRGRIQVSDDDGAPAYECRGELALLSPTWRLYIGEDAGAAPLATIRRRILAWVPTWDIESADGAFQIRRKLLSWTRRYYAVGGAHDGALVEGNLWGLDFTVSHAGRVLASAAGKIFSLRDRHRVQVHGEGEVFVVIAMMVLQIDRRQGEQSGD